jgi:hypothetical protein
VWREEVNDTTWLERDFLDWSRSSGGKGFEKVTRWAHLLIVCGDWVWGNIAGREVDIYTLEAWIYYET